MPGQLKIQKSTQLLSVSDSIPCHILTVDIYLYKQSYLFFPDFLMSFVLFLA